MTPDGICRDSALTTTFCFSTDSASRQDNLVRTLLLDDTRKKPPTPKRGRRLSLSVAPLGASVLGFLLAEDAEVVHDDLSGVALDVVLVGPLAGMQGAFDVEEGAGLETELLDGLCVASPGNEVVPFGILLLFAVAVTVFLAGGEGKGCDLYGLVVLVDGADVSGLAGVSYEDDFVDHDEKVLNCLT